MAALVRFDKEGALGPASTLLFVANRCDKASLDELTNLVKTNFAKLAQRKPKGRKAFIAKVLHGNKNNLPLKIEELIETEFFQNLKHLNAPLPYHKDVVQLFVPKTLACIKEKFSEKTMDDAEESALTLWLGNFLESYISETEVKRASASQVSGELQIAINAKRREIGSELYQKTCAKEISAEDIDKLVSIGTNVVESLKNSPALLEILGKYLTLFSMHEEAPETLSAEVFGLISTVFKKKFFPE